METHIQIDRLVMKPTSTKLHSNLPRKQQLATEGAPSGRGEHAPAFSEGRRPPGWNHGGIWWVHTQGEIYGENMWILFDKHEINNASIHDNISSNAKYVFY